jgi:hypothetical protein
MNDQTSRTPTLRDYGFGSDDEFFQNPGAAIARVAEGIETRLRGEYQAEQQRVSNETLIEENWRKIYRLAPGLRRHDAELRRFMLQEWGPRQPDKDTLDDLDGFIERFVDAAEQHIQAWKRREDEDAEAAAYVGGPGAEDEVDPSMLGTPRSLNSIIKQRRSRFNRSRSA